jgi:hypothetical protein
MIDKEKESERALAAARLRLISAQFDLLIATILETKSSR